MIELLGFAAGLMNLVSSVPQLIANLKNPRAARRQSAARNALQCTGNGLWLAYGLTEGSLAMSTFACLGCLMAGLLFVQVLRSRRRPLGL